MLHRSNRCADMTATISQTAIDLTAALILLPHYHQPECRRFDCLNDLTADLTALHCADYCAALDCCLDLTADLTALPTT